MKKICNPWKVQFCNIKYANYVICQNTFLTYCTYESAFVYDKYIVKYTSVHNKQYKYTVSLFIYIFKMRKKEKQIFYVFF